MSSSAPPSSRAAAWMAPAASLLFATARAMSGPTVCTPRLTTTISGGTDTVPVPVAVRVRVSVPPVTAPHALAAREKSMKRGSNRLRFIISSPLLDCVTHSYLDFVFENTRRGGHTAAASTLAESGSFHQPPGIGARLADRDHLTQHHAGVGRHLCGLGMRIFQGFHPSRIQRRGGILDAVGDALHGIGPAAKSGLQQIAEPVELPELDQEGVVYPVGQLTRKVAALVVLLLGPDAEVAGLEVLVCHAGFPDGRAPPVPAPGGLAGRRGG